MIVLSSVLFLLLPIFSTAELIHAIPVRISATKTAPLSIEELLLRIELTHKIDTYPMKDIVELFEACKQKPTLEHHNVGKVFTG